MYSVLARKGICSVAKNSKPMIGGRPVTLEDHQTMHRIIPRISFLSFIYK